MDIRIAQPFGYSELGSRGNNEDSIFPDPQLASTRQKWFLVCDGVGGAERGELASKLAATSLDAFMLQRPIAVPTDEYIQQAVAYVEDQFNTYISENPQASGMATTMTMLYLHEAGATVAHIGDSRVYHIRNGKVIWRTDDHSYVNELVKAGVITPAEAHRHPQRNVITRALQGGERPVQASVQLINDLRSGDYFFLCSDGVLERVSDELLEGTLYDAAEPNEQKSARLRAYSLGNTRDNFTAYLIQIEQVSGIVDSRYRVALPIYDSFTADTDADETITLINVPIPEAVNADPVRHSAVQGATSAQQTPDAGQQPTAPTRLTTAETSRNPVRPVNPAPVRQASKRWLVAVLAVVGGLLGAGGIIIWQRIADTADVSVNTPRPGVPVNRPVNTPYNQNPALSTSPTDDVDLTITQADEHERISSEATNSGVSATPRPQPADELVRRVDNQLFVVRDAQTKLMGLRKTNGQWATNRIYASIGPFENGVAPVRTDKGPEKYLTKDGKRFTAFGAYKAGIATLVGLDGEETYLTQKGNWLDEVKPPSNGRIAIRKGKYWGYLNLNGEVANYIQYDKAESFDDDGTAEVTLNGKTFRIDRRGTKVVSEEDSDSDKPTKKG